MAIVLIRLIFKVGNLDFVKSSTNKIEKIQFRALKFIYDDTDSTYEELLTKSKLPTLKISRIRTIAIETFKIVDKQNK
jgi:hypothetical protein